MMLQLEFLYKSYEESSFTQCSPKMSISTQWNTRSIFGDKVRLNGVQNRRVSS